MDGPVGTGFSYSESLDGYITGDYKFVAQTYEFLQRVREKVDVDRIYLVNKMSVFFKFYTMVEVFKFVQLIPICSSKKKSLIPIFMWWLNEHPQFLENQFHVGGESYSGIPIPMLVQQIVLGNIRRTKPCLPETLLINLMFSSLLKTQVTITWVFLPNI